MILVTGATGNLGSKIINHLLNHISAHQVAAFVHHIDKAQKLIAKGIDVRIGNYDDTASLETAMNGISHIFLVSGNDIVNRRQQHRNVIDTAKKVGVQYLAYTSFSIRNIETSALKAMMKSHFQTEEYLKSSGLQYTVLRNTYYADGLTMFLGSKEAVLANGIVYPAGEGKVPYVLMEDMAEGFANLLLDSAKHEGQTYNISNAEAYSFDDIAKGLKDLSAENVTYTNIDVDTFAQSLKSMHLPEWMIEASIATASDMKNNQNSAVSNDLERLLGRKPLALEAILRQVYKF